MGGGAGTPVVPGLCPAAPSRPQNQADAHMIAQATSMGALAGITRWRRLHWVSAVLTAGHAQGSLLACSQGAESIAFGRIGKELQPAFYTSFPWCA
jgi:hypothetical protein